MGIERLLKSTVQVLHGSLQALAHQLELTLAVGGAELLEQRTLFAHVLDQRLNQDAIFRTHVPIEQRRQGTALRSQLAQPLTEVSAFRIEEATELRVNALGLTIRVVPELSVDVFEQGLADVVESSFLGQALSIGDGAVADQPGLMHELSALVLIQRIQALNGFGPPVTNGDVEGSFGNGDFGIDVGVGHVLRPRSATTVPSTIRAQIAHFVAIRGR